MENLEIQMFKSTVAVDSVGVISAKPLCDFFGLDWSNQQKLFKSDPHLSQLMVKKPSTGTDGKTYEMIHFTKKGFLRWVQLINPNSVKVDFKEDFLKYQLLIFDYLYGSMEEQDSMQVNYKRMRVLEESIKDAKDELREIKIKVQGFLDNRFGQLWLFS